MSFKFLTVLTFFLIATIFGGCLYQPHYIKMDNISEANLKKTEWSELETFSKDNLDEALLAFRNGCQSPKTTLKKSCELAKDTNNSKDFFINNFTPYKLYDNDFKGTGLITGYYEPLLYGSRTKSERYKYPIYKTPKDLIIVNLSDTYPALKGMVLRGKIDGNKLISYPARKEIEKENDFEPICYVDDKIALFFLHIQGSGKVQFENNETINVGYDGQNGRKYVAVGGQLLKNGHLKIGEVTLQTITKWLKENPEKMDDFLNLNESYIFFNESNKSATGSLGVPLTGGRNLAVDTKSIPLGYPIFLKTKNPLTKENIERLMVAADTGGAIKGKIRADFFFGFGLEAENLAGSMKELGEMYILLPNQN